MTTLELKYNPFSIKTHFFIDGKEASLKCFGTGKDIRLRDYIDNFFSEAIKKCNLGPGSECSFQFNGTQDDFEDVKEAFKKYNEQSEGIKIELLEQKAYPNNFNEMNKIITEKRIKYTDELNSKNENKSLLLSDETVISGNDLFENDRIEIENIFNDELTILLLNIVKYKEDTIFPYSAKKELDDDSLRAFGRKYGYFANYSDLISGNPTIFEETERYTSAGMVRELFLILRELIFNDFNKYIFELNILIQSQFKIIENIIHSEYEKLFNYYSIDKLLSVTIKKNIFSHNQLSIYINKSFPNDFFDKFSIIKEKESPYKYYNNHLNRDLHDIFTFFIKYIETVFETAKENFINNTEKCKAYYIEAIKELHESIKYTENLSLKQKISLAEQEAMLIESKIQCLDELHKEISKEIN